MGTEILFLSLLAYLLFGPQKAAAIAHKAGGMAAQIKRATRDIKEHLLAEVEATQTVASRAESRFHGEA